MLFVSVADQFQVYDEHSHFIEKLMFTSNFSIFGMPIDNAIPADTCVAVSSWCFINIKFRCLTLFQVGVLLLLL